MASSTAASVAGRMEDVLIGHLGGLGATGVDDNDLSAAPADLQQRCERQLVRHGTEAVHCLIPAHYTPTAWLP